MLSEHWLLFVSEEWRPRRSIIFGSWGAEEFGLIGSTEYAEVPFWISKCRNLFCPNFPTVHGLAG